MFYSIIKHKRDVKRTPYYSSLPERSRRWCLICWKNMVIQHLPLEEPLASEITAALMDLATLAQEVGGVAFEALDTLASNMLRRVLALCQAQWGAVLLSEDLDALDQLPLPSPASTKAWRALALHNIHEEEAYALLAAF